MSKTDSGTAPGTSRSSFSLSSHSGFGGTEDIFAYLHSGSSNKPYSALDDFGGAPFAVGAGADGGSGGSGGADGADEDEPKDAPKRGRGRAKKDAAAAGEAAEDGAAAKKRRSAE